MINFMRINRNLRSIRRFRFIIQVLVKYGFDQLLQLLNIPPIVLRRPFRLRGRRAAYDNLLPPERMRLVFEELGPSFIKLGQLLSTRPDVIPRSFADEFSKLQDRVPSFSVEEAREQIRLELGAEVESFYSEFDAVPIAAASIAQVHRARLVSGEEVVAKIRRPGLVNLVETDIDILITLASWAERHVPSIALYDPVAIVREFAHVIRREMDLAREGHTIEKFAANFTDDPTMYFPKVYWNETARGVLTLEYIDGIKVTEIDELERAGLDRYLIARRGADSFLKMVLTHGFFHGDPHPGNVYVLPGNVICLLDYGMVGRLDPRMRDFLTEVLFTVINRDVEELISLLLDAGDIAENLNMRALRRDLGEFIDSYYEIPLRDISVGRLLMEFVELVNRYRIRLEPDLMLLGKALVNIEGMGRQLDPGFDMIRQMRPFVEANVREKAEPGNILRGLRSSLMSYFHLTRSLPRDIKEIINRINRDKFKIDLEHRGLDRYVREIDKSMNRLSSSLVMAALLIGSSIIIHAGRGPFVLGFPLLASIGYAVATFMGVWIVIAILRSGRL
jgi:ubiquinone biosynthesis protein